MKTPVRLRLLVVALLCTAGLLSAPIVSAAETGPQWTITSVSRPTNLSPIAKPGEDSYRVLLTNTGGASNTRLNGGSTEALPVTVTEELPEGLAPDPVGVTGENHLSSAPDPNFSCALRSCTYAGVVVPGETLEFTFPVDVSPGPFMNTCEIPVEAVACLTNVVRVSGGGAPVASMSTPTTISKAPAGFGFSPGGASTALSSDQAGAHPDITNSIAFNTVNVRGATAADFKDITYRLPPGFASDFVDTPSCPEAEFSLQECPIATQVGVTTITFTGALQGPYTAPVYNLTPNAGEIAKFGFLVGEILVEGGVRLNPNNYAAEVVFPNTNQSGTEVNNVSLTIWGVPADPIHDPLRRQAKVGESVASLQFGASSDAARVPFFTNATSCGTGPLHSAFQVDSWQEPGRSIEETMSFGPLVGCDRLGMEPSLVAEVTSDSAYAPTGLDLRTLIPQTYENPEGLATSTLKRETVTLPEGMTVNPSSGAGLQACSEAQYAEEEQQYVPGRGCPNQSRLATVKIKTPALSEEVTGSAFLAEPAPFGEAGKNPFGSLLALYIVARIPNRGVLVKAPGEVRANETTGQLVTTFGATPAFDGIPASEGLPPLPASVITFNFNQGANAPLVTPPTCGAYEVKAALTPWSDPEGASPLTPLIPPFEIDTNCPAGGVPPFAPQAVAGTADNNAGSYSPLYLRIVRNDGEQEITGFASQLPPGLTGNLSGVPFCPEADIQRAREKTGVQEEGSPSCPVASEIGHTIAEAGVGSVLAQAPGKLYLGGPFAGAPFSVVSITSAHVGPFDLGTVVVHLPLDINPETADVTIPSGQADQIPHIIKGIVVHIRDIRVYVDRPNFMLNPTNCDPMSFGATVIGGGADPTNPADNDPVTITNPFQAADCASLKFAPKFAVSTAGKTSKADGASLTVKLAYPSAPQGTQTNIKRVKVELPRQLPSRLTTLQKACTAAQFKANPAGCPAASVIGHARAMTPILPVPLEGPAYFVSNGGEAFPNLIVVLQGDGVTIDLVGDTFISKAGITSSTFKTVPDQPVTSFELTLPQGPFSALAANGNLCSLTKTVTTKRKVIRRVSGRTVHKTVSIRKVQPASLVMPTEFVGQNGAATSQNTRVSVTGCPKAKTVKGKQHKAAGRRRSKRK